MKTFFRAFIFFSLINYHSAFAESFLLIPDIHTNSDPAAPTMELDPAKQEDSNNLDSKTFDTFMQKITSGIAAGTVAKPDFVIFLGDMVQNALSDSSEKRIQDETSVFTKLKNTFPTTPIFYVFGNHDNVNGVWGPFYDSNPAEGFYSPFDVATKNADWKDGFLSTGTICNGIFTKPCLIDENIRIGFYAAYLKPHLRLIVLNTPLLDVQAINPSIADINTQFAWFNTQMQNAAAFNDSVLIAMHVPLGKSLGSEPEANNAKTIITNYDNTLLQIISNYQQNVIGVLAGHTHFNSMRVFTLNGEKVGFLLNPAALSTYSTNAPSFQTVSFYNNNFLRNNKWIISDYDTYNFIPKSKDDPTILLNHLYKFSDYYCNGQAINMLNCLDNITAEKMTANNYYVAGNPKSTITITNPENVFIALPPPNNAQPQPPTPIQPENNNSKNKTGIIAASVAGAAAIFGGIMFFYDENK